MKQNIVAVIAHPDDEAFGPAGLIARFAKEGNDVYIICATKGESGENRKEGDTRSLGNIREEELMASANILGVKKVFMLGFKDGTLSNNLYHEIANKILAIFQEIKPSIIITTEPLGISGHLDHIAVSMIATYSFYHFPLAKTLYYQCQTKEREKTHTKLYGEYFVYKPPGYDLSEIDEVVDVSSVWDIKTAAIQAHASQKKDFQRILHVNSLFPKEEYYLVRRK